MTTKTKEEILKKVYNNISNPASFGTVNQLYEAVKGNDISLKETKEWLEDQLTHSLHKPKRKIFTRNPIIASYKDDLWQSDIVDMKSFKNENNGNSYIVTVIDVFSKYAWAFPIKRKIPQEVSKGFEDILKDRQPGSLQTDQGSEFSNKYFSKFLKDNSIHYYTTRNTETKCAVVERFNRTLRTRMFKYFTAKGTRKYIDVLDKLVSSYNSRNHSSIGMAPCQVKSENTPEIFKKLYGYNSKRELLKRLYGKTVLKVGDKVRISYMAAPLDKGYYPNWTDEVFTVYEAINNIKRAVYKIKDYMGEPIEGTFYPEELQKIEGDRFRIKILKQRTRNGIKEALVNWLNYPDSANTWVPLTSIGEI